MPHVKDLINSIGITEQDINELYDQQIALLSDTKKPEIFANLRTTQAWQDLRTLDLAMWGLLEDQPQAMIVYLRISALLMELVNMRDSFIYQITQKEESN